MDPHALVELMVSVGNRYTIDVHDFRALTLKLIVLSVKYVSKTALWASRFGDAHVHWELVNGIGNRNLLGGCTEWLTMLSFCKWDEMGKHDSAIQVSLPPLHKLKCNMKECGLDTGGPDMWSLTCRVYLIILIQGLQVPHTLELMTCALFKRNTHTGCMQLLASQVEPRPNSRACLN